MVWIREGSITMANTLAKARNFAITVADYMAMGLCYLHGSVTTATMVIVTPALARVLLRSRTSGIERYII